jgi:sugar lactone lactonase YvrE/two-component sensor histidine kinase
MSRTRFTSYDETDGLGGTRIASILENRRGELCVIPGLIGTPSIVISCFDGRRFVTTRVNLQVRLKDPGWGWHQVSFQDREGEWWIATGEGLFRFPSMQGVEPLGSIRPKAVYTIRDGLAGSRIFRLFEDSIGDLWIGTLEVSEAALTRWERATGRFHRYDAAAHGLPRLTPTRTAVAPTAFAEDRAGRLWIGWYTGGLTRYASGRFELFTEADGLPAGQVRGLFLDRKGRLWIATSEGGLGRIDEPTAKRPHIITYTTRDGLASNQVNCVTQDNPGHIYIGTGRGLDRLEPTTGRIKHYTTGDGLANNFVNVTFRDRDGALWFGTLQGLSRLISPAQSVVPAPPVFISALRVGGTTQPLGGLGDREVSGLEFGSRQNHVEIDYFAIAFGGALRYRYQLEGAHGNSNHPTDQRSVTYANLVPGAYRFRVDALTSEGGVSASPAIVSFRILPPLWQRSWFLTTTSALTGLLIAIAYRSRVAHLLALERVRMGIATDLHDDIGSNLSQIAILSEVARRQIGPNGSPAARPLDLIANLSRASVDSMSDIVWATNPEKDWAANLVTRMRNLANEVLAARDIDFAFNVTGEPQARIEAQLRRQVFLVFKESLNNVVRHSGSTKVDIALHLDHHALVLRVSDQGKGFDTGAASDGHGLASMRGRAASLGGRLEVVTSQSGGTCLMLTVPRRRLGASHERTPSPPA